MAKVLTALAAALVVLLAFCSYEVRGDESTEVRESLIKFLTTLAGDGGSQTATTLGWNASIDPCRRGTPSSLWGRTVTCFGSDSGNDGLIKRIDLGSHALTGTIDAALLCAAPAVRVLNVSDNSLRGGIPDGISACSGLTHLIVTGNHLSGNLPASLTQLNSLHVIEVARNNFSGQIPGDLTKLNLERFMANDNHFNGTIPDFNLDQLQNFTVSNNNLTGPVPKNAAKFGNQSFWPNAAGMCGEPLFDSCPLPPSEADDDKHEKRAVPKIVMYLGYVLLGAAVLGFVLYKICSKKKRNKLDRKSNKPIGGKKGVYDSSKLTTTTTTTSVVSPSKSAYSIPTSAEHSVAAAAAAPSASLVVLRRSGTASPITSKAAAAAAKDLRFEDLLKSPAELLGRGRFGSSYKVVVPGGAALAVKRVKDVVVNEEAFRRRMERIGRAKHKSVLPPLAFYCAMQEKLVVYEFQSNGSLEKLLHGSIESSQGPLDWAARLHIAAKVADGMAFMHTALSGGDGAASNSPSSGEETAAATDGPIAHGNLKASNVLFTAGMDPCISEYGVTSPSPPAGSDGAAALRGDVHAFGVLLLELLTGKATSSARGDGAELARWVTSVIREEWTAEVFDRALLSGGGGAGDGSYEQRMVRLLQVAMRCVDASPGSPPPPNMREVAGMVNAIREEDDRSFSLEA